MAPTGYRLGIDDSRVLCKEVRMEIKGEPPYELRPASASERANALSQAFADVARLARVSKRSRRALATGGFQGRRGARTFRVLGYVSFFLMVVAPSFTAAGYYGLFASSQYVSEAKFTLGGGEPPTTDTFGSVTGIPAIAIIQDTQIVTDFIHSRAAVEQLEQKVGLRSLYSKDNIDSFSRLDPNKPIEKVVRYWEGMSSATIGMPAGIVDLKVRAFSPQDAQRIAAAVVEISEALINNMNARMNQEGVANAEAELARTSARLTKASLALEAARNETGLLDTAKSSDAISKLIADMRETLLTLQQHYSTQLHYVSETAPQMVALRSRIDAASAQIAELESKLTTTDTTTSPGATMASSMTKFAELNLERQVAERLYAAAASSLEIAHVVSERKFMYLNTFVTPVVAEEPQYPKRVLNSVGICLGSLAIWGACCGLATLVRNYGA